MSLGSAASLGGQRLVAAARPARAAGRAARLAVRAKVDLQGAPRVIRGRCFVTRDVSPRRRPRPPVSPPAGDTARAPAAQALCSLPLRSPHARRALRQRQAARFAAAARRCLQN
jgi:hypothetical protein